MTEWTVDWAVPATEIDPSEDGKTVRDPGESPYADLVAGALIEDLELDRAEWFE